MGFNYTRDQQKVLDARNHNILVSAAAGSGKTAVLVERIVRLISEGDRPLDIDRLLVVTFTKAAAEQMRERIGKAISERLQRDPSDSHLQRQEILLHNAQITTMDSFFTFLLRNYFSEIDLDPGFRQIDETESRLLAADVLEDFLEEKYTQKDPAFLACAEWFCPGSDDHELEELILDLCRHAGSHPSPEAWLKERALDYDVADEQALFETPWMRSMVVRMAGLMLDSDSSYAAMQSICLEPGGPDIVWPFLQEERDKLFGGIRSLLEGREAPDPQTLAPDLARELWREVLGALERGFARYPAISSKAKKYAYIDTKLKDSVKRMRDTEKDRLQKLGKKIGGQTPEMILAMMEAAREPVRTLSELALEYHARLAQVKRDRHMIDFVDLEHLALDILAERQEDGSYRARRAAKALRGHYAEILIDEYQDSNEVQELLLQIISGEEDGKYNRFMVGDIKQSIYRFRLARPEIFMEKYNRYRPDDPELERIELDQNFRSRREVLDPVNALFRRIMRREVGGVDYTENASLKKGAVYPGEDLFRPEDPSDPYRAEFLLLETGAGEQGEESSRRSRGPEDGSGAEDGGPEDGTGEDLYEEEDAGILADAVGNLTDRQKEALMIAGRIRQLVGKLQVTDEKTGDLRPARYGDIVILLRATKGWNEDLRAVFEREGIPAYAESRTGYFMAGEIRTVLGLLRVLDNPRQDIPLYGTMRGFYGDFSQDEIAAVRMLKRDGSLYEALRAAAAVPDPGPAPVEKCRAFLGFIDKWRERARYRSVPELLSGLLEETGYQDYCAALPAGPQRAANLQFLRSQADAFTKTDFTGLFQFLRYIDGLKKQEIDYGEANTLDENADVVRIMSIHKSKGLEFPICFVAGLSKGFGFRTHETRGTMVYDGDWGTGVHYYDPVSRVRTSTLRREEIAEKICRDSMGEELRVLYVAMTRAKEKLILTAAIKGLEKKIRDWEGKLAGYFMNPDRDCLSPFLIGGAGSFAELVWQGAMAHLGPEAGRGLYDRTTGPAPEADTDTGTEEERNTGAETGADAGPRERADGTPAELPMTVRILSEKDLQMQAAEDQTGLAGIRESLLSMEGRPLEDQPDPAAASDLADRFFRVYPHEELRDLYAQTSVSEIKHRAMNAAMLRMEEAAGGPAPGALREGAFELFPQVDPVPYLPSFLQEKPLTPGDDAGRAHLAAAEGARRGTAFHRVLELLDYSERKSLLRGGPEEIASWLEKLAASGRIRPEDAALVRIKDLIRFLRSPLADRMEAAAGQGRLFREQPFVLGVSADRIGEGLPEDETVMVQGIIDAFFFEGDSLVLVDYKTDRVRAADELVLRYQTQLDIYGEALESAYGAEPAEKILYSTALGREIRI